MVDNIQFIIMIGVERHGSTHLPSYTIRLDNQILENKTIPDFKSNDSFASQFDVELDHGPHTLYIEYNNPENRGLLRIENIYVGTAAGGFSLDQMVISQSSTKSNVLKGTALYAVTFTSPFFYWALLHSKI